MKSHSFSKKLLSLFLAVIMALSCCTAAFSAFAASADTENELYEFNNEYDALGWVKTTDEQKLSAILDWADNMLATNMGTMVQSINLNDLLGVNLGLPTININLSNINGVLSTVNSVRNALGNLGGLLGGDVKKINLKGVLKGYAQTGSGSTVMTRENSTSKEIVAGILNLLYMNTNDYAFKGDKDGGAFTGGNVIQSILNGTLDIGGLQGIVESAIGGPLYDVIANAAGLPKGFQTNAVNNLAISMIAGLASSLATTNPDVFSKTASDGTTWYFQDNSGKRLTLEEWGFDTIQKALINQFKNINGEPVFKGNEFKLEVTDAAMTDFLAIIKPVLQNSLVPLFSTISVDFFHIPQITRMYADWKMAQPGFKAPTTESELNNLWTKANVEAWIKADTKNIATYLSGLKDWDGVAMCPTITASSDAATVQAELVRLFKSLDRHNKENIDVAYLFTNMLFSPVAKALGCETGVLNLNVRDYYFGNFGKFFDMGAVKNNVLDSVYPLVKEFFKAVLPGFTAWETPATNESVDGLVAKFVKTAGKMIAYVADGSSEAILNDFHTNHPGADLTEDTIEEAIVPLLVSFVYHGKTFEQIHPETWAKVKDLNGFIYVLMEEYLKQALPEFDYSSLAYDKAGNLNANLETVLLPMARDCVAVLVQGIVPLKWDVYTKGGVVNGALRDKTTVFELANEVLCFFADDLGIAPLLGFTEFAMNTGSKSATKSAINRSNDIWTNADLMINKVLPAFSSLFSTTEGSFKSKDFFYTTILNGVLNMNEVNNSTYGHGKKGFSALLYNLVYLLTQSAPLNKTPIVNVAYNVIRSAANTLFGARNAEDGFGDFLPANTGKQPFTDLLQNKVMSGGSVAPSSACAAVNGNGVIGILFGRIAENAGAGNLYRKVADTVMPGALNTLYCVNAALSFIPQLSRNTFHGAYASLTRGLVNDLNAFDQNNVNYIAVDNKADGIKRAYIEGGSAKTIDRYFIQVTGIACTNDSKLTADASKAFVLQNGKYVAANKTLIAPGERLYFNLAGAPTNYGGKNFEVSYKIVDKNGKDYPGFAGTYKTTTTLDVSQVSWHNEVFKDGVLKPDFKIDPNNSGTKQIKFPGTNEVAVERTDYFGECSRVPAGRNHMAITYPKRIVIDPNNAGQLTNMKLAAFCKYNFKGWGLGAVYPYANGNTGVMTPSFDKEGNILDYTRTDYYFPVTNQWLVGQKTLEQNGRVYSYTKSRPHVEYTKAAAEKLAGYKATWDAKGECTGITINYNKGIYKNITCATSVPGTYQKMPTDIEIKAKDYVPYAWIYPTGEAVKPGSYTIDMFVDASYGSANGKKIQIKVDVVDTNKLPVLQTVYNEAISFVNTHAPEEFASAAQLKALQEEVAKARVLLDAQLSRSVVSTFGNDVNNEITTLKKALKDAKANVTSETANEVVEKVIKNFESLNINDYENVTFNLTRDIYNYACRLVKAEYDNPTWVACNSTDKNFNKLGQYKFFTKDGFLIDQCMYTTFILNLQAGKYEAAFGLNANSVEGTDYKFGYEEPQRDPVTNQIKYKYSNNATVAEMKEAIRLYELYSSKLVVKAYDANDNALMKEILCATGAKSDATDAALKKFIDTNITVGADGSINYTAGITPKYGELQNGKLVNKGYTEQTWKAYTDALAAAVKAVKAGTGKVSELNALRVNVMLAENRLEKAAIKDVTYTYTFADGHTETVVAPEGTAPKAPANTAATCKPNGDHKNHTTTTYTWPTFVQGTTSYKEVATDKVEACSYEVVKTEPTRGENGKNVYTCSVCHDTYEEVIPALGVTVTVDEAKLGTVTINATDRDGKPVTGPATNHVVKYQTSYTLTATAGEKAKFVGWYSGNKLISTEATYTTTAYADTTYTPVFQEVNDNVFTVTFMGYYGNIIKTVTSTELASLTKLPDAPNDYIGWTFTGWDMTLEQVKALKESTVLHAQYTRNEAVKFTVTANGCTISVDGVETQDTATNVPYNAKVVVTPKSGTATSWLMNGKVAGYDANFTFYCGADATVTFTTETVAKEPTVSILSDTEDATTHRVTFLASRSVPEGYTLIESGFVYGKGAMTTDDLKLENVGIATPNGKVVQLKNANTSPDGQFSITFGIKNQSAPASARAYVVYADSTGTTHVVYSDAVVHNFAK